MSRKSISSPRRLTDLIRHGSRVTILVASGLGIDRTTGRLRTELREATGRAVMRSSHGGWVLNMGGRYGRPGIADETNVVAVSGRRANAEVVAG